MMIVSFERSLSGVEITTEKLHYYCCDPLLLHHYCLHPKSRTDNAEAAELAHGLNSMPVCVLTHSDDREF